MSCSLRAATLCAVLFTAGSAFAAGYGGGTGSGGSAATAGSDMAMSGKITTPAGMSLYVFDKDIAGASTCYGDCASEWPPMLAEAHAMASDTFGLVTRSNGSRQWTYMGHPLYMFDEDLVAGDINGASYSADWHLATAAH